MKTTILPYSSDLRPFVEYLAAHRSEEDAYESEALGQDPNDVEAVVLLAERSLDCRIAFVGVSPVFVYGAVQLYPTVAGMWGLGVAKRRRAIPRISHQIRTEFIPGLVGLGVRRAEVHVPERNVHSISWLCSLGYSVEAVKEYGCVDGSSLVELSYTIEDYRRYVQNKNAKAA